MMEQQNVTGLQTSTGVGNHEANGFWQQFRQARLRNHAGAILLTGYLVLCAVPALFGVFAVIRSL